MTKFYDTKEFKKLNSLWKKRLKDEGFDDIEQSETHLKQWHSYRFKPTKDKFATNAKHEGWNASKIEYYDLAVKFLNSHKFKDKKQYTIWKLHSEGVSFAKIDKHIQKNSGTARRVIYKLRVLMRFTCTKEE